METGRRHFSHVLLLLLLLPPFLLLFSDLHGFLFPLVKLFDLLLPQRVKLLPREVWVFPLQNLHVLHFHLPHLLLDLLHLLELLLKLDCLLLNMHLNLLVLLLVMLQHLLVLVLVLVLLLVLVALKHQLLLLPLNKGELLLQRLHGALFMLGVLLHLIKVLLYLSNLHG
jgi:hypothetical protein